MKFLAILSVIVLLASCGDRRDNRTKPDSVRYHVHVGDTTTILYFRNYDKAEMLIMNTFDADSITTEILK